MQLVVTGAGGFLGRVLVTRLLREYAASQDRFALIDHSSSPAEFDSRVHWLTGDFAEARGLDAALAEADIVLHLAAVPGGAAVRDYALAKRVNLDSTLGLMEKVAAHDRRVRFVYASTIAVFGTPLPVRIDDGTLPRPTLTYGAHKLMAEVALENLTRIGQIDGVALRFPGLVARPAGGSGMRSAFMSELFHACVARRPFVVPTRPEATVWVMSASCAVVNLLHAAQLAAPASGVPRAFTLPALRVTMAQLVDAVARQAGCRHSLISFECDPALEAQFGQLPPLATPLATSLGFVNDGDLDKLVTRALRDAGYAT